MRRASVDLPLSRRRVLIACGLVALGARSAMGQPSRLPTVGVLRVNPQDSGEFFAEPFRRNMLALGWEEGRTIRYEFRWADGRNEHLPALAAELVARDVDVLVTFGNLGIRAAQGATQIIPIVGMSDDMVGSGLAVSVARPGGNTSGVSILGAELDLKRLELLSECVPQARRIGVIADPTVTAVLHRQKLEDGASRLGLELVVALAQNRDEIDRALDRMAAERVGAVDVLASPVLNGARAAIVDRLGRARLPAIYEWPETAEEGGLLGYGARITLVYRQVAVLVDKVLRGAKPADLPIEQPTKFELVVNLKTAEAMGLEVPQPILLRADEVIE